MTNGLPLFVRYLKISWCHLMRQPLYTVLTIFGLAIGSQTMKAANQNPVESLKYE